MQNSRNSERLKQYGLSLRYTHTHTALRGIVGRPLTKEEKELSIWSNVVV